MIANGEGKILNGGCELLNESYDLCGEEINELYGYNVDTNLHGYDEISHGCGTQIQLENPDKKEALVCDLSLWWWEWN